MELSLIAQALKTNAAVANATPGGVPGRRKLKIELEEALADDPDALLGVRRMAENLVRQSDEHIDWEPLETAQSFIDPSAPKWSKDIQVVAAGGERTVRIQRAGRNWELLLLDGDGAHGFASLRIGTSGLEVDLDDVATFTHQPDAEHAATTALNAYLAHDRGGGSHPNP